MTKFKTCVDCRWFSIGGLKCRNPKVNEHFTPITEELVMGDVLMSAIEARQKVYACGREGRYWSEYVKFQLTPDPLPPVDRSADIPQSFSAHALVIVLVFFLMAAILAWGLLR